MRKDPRGRGFSASDPLFPWPIGVPDGGLELPSPRDEPGPSASRRPDFGEGPCGEAAARLWQEHLDDPFTRLVGPSPAHEQHLKDQAERCRRRGVPDFDGPCARTGELAYARRLVEGEDADEARRAANVAVRLCELLRDGLGDSLRPSWGGGRPWRP